eukprot:9409600-Lingulodinium_polyedra.AAC.1
MRCHSSSRIRSSWEAPQRRAIPRAARAAAASQAPKYRPPMATTPGPKGLCTMARRRACRCDCGVN